MKIKKYFLLIGDNKRQEKTDPMCPLELSLLHWPLALASEVKGESL